MKRSGKRLLAVLLCLAMAMTLLPMSAFARWDDAATPAIPAEKDGKAAVKAELPVTAEGDDAQAELSEGVQGWVARDDSAASCVTEESDGKIRLTATGVANFNATGSAVIINNEISEALNSVEGEKFFEAVFEPHCDAVANTAPAFGLAINAESMNKAYYLGFDNGSKWYSEYYGGTDVPGSSTWPGWGDNNRPADVVSGTKYKIRVTWNNAGTGTASVKVWVGDEITNGSAGTEYTLPNDGNLCSITGNGKIAIKTSNYASATNNYVLISDIDYSGKVAIPTYSVTGTVKDRETSTALAGVIVTASTESGRQYTAEPTQVAGAYTLVLPSGTYTLTASKEGYSTATKSVTVGTAALSGQDFQLEAAHTMPIPDDGVNDTWIQVAGSKKSSDGDASHDPELVDGKLVLQASFGNVNNFNADAPAIFTNATLDAALAKTTGEKFLSFTVVPENRNSGSGEDAWMGFGIVLDYNDAVGSGVHGYHIGYPSGVINGWFVQYYGGTPTGAAAYPGFTAPNVEYGQPLKVEIRWTDDTVTLKLNDVSYNLPNSGGHMGVPTTNKVAIKVGAKEITSDALQYKVATKLTLTDIHYSGQKTVTGHYVRGVVKGSDNKNLAGATVTATSGTTTVTATADASGAYSMVLPEADTAYTVKAELDGYSTESVSVTVNGQSNTSTLENTNFTLTLLPTISGTVKNAQGQGLIAAIQSDKREAEGKPAVTSDESGKFTIIGAVSGEHTLTVTAEGYETTTKEVTVSGSNVTGVNIVLQDRQMPYYTLSTADMDVKVAQGFPQAIEYTMKGALAGKKMYGQTAELDTIKINNTPVKPRITSVLDETTNQKVTYTMVVDNSNNNGTGVTATITAELRVGLDDLNDQTSAAAGRTLGFYITDVTYANNSRLTNPVKTIEIPNHSLVSVRSTETGAAVTGGKLANNTTQSGDSTYRASDSVGANNYVDYFAAFVYNNQLSAGLSSNSAYAAAGTAGNQCFPVRAQFEEKDGGTSESIGLGSTLWYYDYDISNSEAGGDQRLIYDGTGENLSQEQRIIAPLETPYAKVVIAGDTNGNGKVDWQDGAIAYRETVMHIPANSENVADSVNLRISMNFGSMAANPFLIALDNVKRVAAHTDGLGQFVLLKGYAGEGHDSNHPQYDNIGVRMGGAEDMLTLMEEGGELGATFGIHVNASELYAEAIENGTQVRRYSNGSLHYGWNWLDQGIAINGVYDYASGLRKARWDKLYEIVKGHPFVVYVDVWGNNTSGTEDAFQTRALSNEIVSHDGWRVAQEWSWANPYESTFQHWVTDYTYGNFSDKGKLNSNVLRFILNQYKDSFPPDFATFGGAANAPLLGGPAMQGFEGWQGDGEYDLSIYNTYNQMVYTKFLQHYPVVEWINAENTVALPYSEGANGARSNTSDWTPEMQIKLSDGKDTIVVTRGTSGTLNTTASFSLDNEVEYRSRVVTLNGKTIVTGAPASAGEDNAFPASRATLKYLIPWYWDANGERVTADNEKLYHWNAQGGQSTWELPSGWEKLVSVMVYELSDQGRGTGKSVNVVDGRITLADIKSNTGYVVTKGADKATAPAITYGTGLHLEDPSFNIDTPNGPWKIEGTGSAVHTTNSQGIGVMKMIGTVSVSQEMKELKAGKIYVSYVAVDNRSNAKVSMTITDETGKVVATNYTEKSIARNYVSSYYLHNGHSMEAGGSFFQNMYVYFTPEEGKTYTMTLSREAGSGNVYFDDLRTLEYRGDAMPVVYDEETGAATSLTQDFENVPQGLWPFVVGPVEGVADNRTHLSELNAPFTQAGWDVKKLDDVIGGKWSIKSNGLSGRNNLVYQTIPQNFRFEADKVYTVGFDYELGSAGSYVAVVGDGAYTNLDGMTAVYTLDQTLNTMVPNNSGTAKANVGHIEFTVVGSKSGQTWIGIYSKNAANNQGTSGSEAAFGGYTDFVLDNLTIELAPAEKTELALLLQEADLMAEDNYIEKTTGAWSTFDEARTNGHTVFDNEQASLETVTAAVEALKNAIANLEKVNISISGTVINANNAPVAGVELTLEDSAYIPVGLIVTTGDNGTFTFESKNGVDLTAGTYHIKAQATGYNVLTTEVIEVTKTNGQKTQNISLEAENPGAYVNDFNSGDISMMGYLVPETTENLPTLEATTYNGSGALKITWNAGSGETRHLNNVVDKTKTMKNGSVSFDVVPLTNNGLRFGITFRGQMGTSENANRVFVGQEDAVKEWFVEYWNSAASRTTGYIAKDTKDIGLDNNVKRNVRAEINEMQFKVYVDGVMIYNVDASKALPGMPTEAGYVGFNMRLEKGSEYIIDNLRIISADAAEGVQNVSGTVTAGGSGEAISGAAIDLYDGETRVSGTATNALGAYLLTDVAPGNYTLKVSAPFFKGKEKAITVETTNLTGEDFTLELDLSDLEALIAEVEALNEMNYTEESWAVLEEALAAAKAIDDNASIAALNTAYRDLSNAKDALEAGEVDAVDFSGLRDLYNEMAKVESTGYTTDSWNEFLAARSDAFATLSDGNATQEQVDAAKNALQAAYNALARADKLDLSALKVAYEKAKNLNESNYTAESWAPFEAARNAALAIISNANGLTQAAVDAATKALTDAQNGLKTSGGSGGGTGGGGSTGGGGTGGGGAGGGGGAAGGGAPGTRRDGAIVTTVTNPDGSTTETVKQTNGTVSQIVTDVDGDVTITVTDATGEEIAKVTLPATTPTPDDTFIDLDPTPWAEDAINHMAGLKLVNGVGGSKYDPTASMTRGSLATVLYRLSNGKNNYAVTFNDVAKGQYYTEGVAWAAKAGVVTGYTEDTFAPNDTITREQLAVMLARYAKLIGMDTTANKAALDKFADGSATGGWAADGMAWCVEKGILQGKGANNLDPTAKITRAEVAVMLDRFIALIK